MSMSDAERMLENANLPGPRITRAGILETIESIQYHRFEGTTVTVCCAKLRNGYTAVGSSACADPANFRKAIGEEFAFEDAVRQIWPLEGYLLRQRLFAEAQFRDEDHQRTVNANPGY